MLSFIRPCANNIFNIYNSYGIKLLTRLRLGLSHLHDYNFRHCFQDTLNSLCDCGNDTETKRYFFLHSSNFHTRWQTLLKNFRNINEQIFCHGEVNQMLLYGNPNCDLTVKRLVLNATIEYPISTERFKCSFLN